MDGSRRMTERERIEAMLDALNTVYEVGNDRQTAENVRLEIKKLLLNKDLADILEGNGKSTGAIVERTFAQNYIRLLEKKVKERRHRDLQYFLHGFFVAVILGIAITYFLNK